MRYLVAGIRMTNAQVRLPSQSDAIKIIRRNKQFSFWFYFCQLCATSDAVHVQFIYRNFAVSISSPDCFDKSSRYEYLQVFDFSRSLALLLSSSLILFLSLYLSPFFALSALKWIAKIGPSISKRARTYIRNIHLTSILLMMSYSMIEEKVPQETFLHI